MMAALDYYNEHDKFAAAWLRELIAAGEIPSGHVDERDIQDVQPSDLVGYRHCHFFAGIGGWAYALRLAGWPDDQPIWTGSAPCQPFSAAGQGAGFADERHLWPSFFWLISQCQPRYVCGEQVASGDALRWWDLVATDLEGAGYACTAVDLPAASVGAPHKRSRLFWLADAKYAGHYRPRGAASEPDRDQQGQWLPDGDCREGAVADASHDGRRGRGWPERDRPEGRQQDPCGHQPDGCGDGGGLLAHARGQGSAEQRRRRDESSRLATASGADAWADLVWLPCTDGKARPTQPGLQPLAYGVPNRVGTLCGAGNAIVPQTAAEVLRAWQAVMS